MNAQSEYQFWASLHKALTNFPTERRATAGVDPVFWLEFRRSAMSLAAIIKRHKLDRARSPRLEFVSRDSSEV
jgi:hypothetical protein